ncbi:uncharacterized protein [Ptychodera flava]|uniref:uncharacterized protein n=1 Tax=Ptychodera flava TaxID=63121 RepID=UPI003969C512
MAANVMAASSLITSALFGVIFRVVEADTAGKSGLEEGKEDVAVKSDFKIQEESSQVLTPAVTIAVIYCLAFLLFAITWVPWYIGLRSQRKAKSKQETEEGHTNDVMTMTDETPEQATSTTPL